MDMYGSLQNRLMERASAPQITIGMGVTECLWSDRHAWEVVGIKDDRHITIRRMGYKCLDWFGGDWEVFPNENGEIIRLYKTNDGVWRQRIGRNGLGDTRFSVGRAEEYRDPSF